MNSHHYESFGVRFTRKNYSSLEFLFYLFLTCKELWGQIEESDPSPTDETNLGNWNIKDSQLILLLFLISGCTRHLRSYMISFKRFATQIIVQDAFSLHIEMLITLTNVFYFRIILLYFRTYGRNL